MDKLLSLLSGVVREGKTVRALCPAHSDLNPSLTITEGDNGDPLIKCQAGCKTEDVLRALGVTWADILHSQVGVPEGIAHPSAPVVQDPSILNQRYSDILSRQTLFDSHKQELLARGLNEWDIQIGEYKTFGGGLAIPVKDLFGRIVGIHIRTGDPGCKYQWYSSTEWPSGTPIHVARRPNHNPKNGVIRITEGPLKANVAYALGEWIPCLGVPGVGQWKGVIPIIKEMQPSEVRLAFDADWRSKDQVRQNLQDMAMAIEALGFKVLVETWNPEDGKGIDDVLLHGGKIDVLPLDSMKEGDPTIWDDGCQVVCLSTVTPKKVDWIWDNWFIRSGVNLIDGDPGLGKSTLVAEIIGAVTTGRPLPGGSQGNGLGVLILNGEDDLASTFRPRLDASEADCSKVYSYTGRLDPKTGEEVPPSLPEDLVQIEALIRRYHVGLVVVDPLFGYVSTKLDMHRDQHVKYLLAQLARMALRTGVGIIGVRHLTKGSQGGPGLYRGQGSIGIVGAARTCAAVSLDPDDPRGRLLLPLKNNLAETCLPIKFTLASVIISEGVSVGRVKWGERVLETSESVLRRLCQAAQGHQERDNLGVEAQFIIATLARGPKLASEMYDKIQEVLHYGEGKAKGIANRLQLKIYKSDNRWWWALPVDWKELGIKT